MKLLPSWEKEIKKVGKSSPKTEKPVFYTIPAATDYYGERIIYVSSAGKAKDMVELALQRPLSHISMDVIFEKDQIIEDPRSIHPFAMSFVLAEPVDSKKGALYRFVVDLRKSKVIPVIDQLFRLPVCFVGHNLKDLFFCLWKLDLPEPQTVWDTQICEKALTLGMYPKYRVKKGDPDLPNQIRKNENAKEKRAFQSLLSTICLQHGIPCLSEDDRETLRESFIDHPQKKSFTKQQRRNVVKTAVAITQLYQYQINAAVRTGVLQHLVTFEMPFIKTNARMEWVGIGVNQKKCRQKSKELKQETKRLRKRIRNYGIDDPLSHPRLVDFFRKVGLLDRFKVQNNYSFEIDSLKPHRKDHPVIPDLIEVKKMPGRKNSVDELSEFVGSDGRLHPRYDQLGTDTGRLTCQNPSIFNLEHCLRSLIIAGKGRGIGVADYCQFEIGIAAVVYYDSKLIQMYNTGDVYCAMAKQFFRTQLSQTDLSLSDKRFKKEHKKFRAQMKICALGIIYGITPMGLAKELNCSVNKATEYYNKFVNQFPEMQRMIDQIKIMSVIRGYSSSVTNLHQNRANKGTVSEKEKRRMAHFPIQAAAAAIFKTAGNRLDTLYRPYDAQLIIPLHDEFVFEAPINEIDEVAELTEKVMCESMQEFFPELRPKVEIDISTPGSWG